MLYVLVLVLVLVLQKANVPQCGISALSLRVVPGLIWLALNVTLITLITSLGMKLGISDETLNNTIISYHSHNFSN